METCASRLKSGNDAYDDIVDSLKEIIDIVNYKGGWTVYGWDKIGLINDVSLLGTDNKETGNNNILSQDI